MPDLAEARRRWFGLFFLVGAGGMLIWGTTVLRPSLNGLAFLLYWLVCFVLTSLAIVIAIMDMRATRRRAREEQRELLERTWNGIEHRPDDWDQTR